MTLDKAVSDRINSAYDALSNGDFSSAYEEFQELSLVHTENTDIWLNLGWLYQTGSGIDKNLSEAMVCYEKAAKMGSPIANYYLATTYKEEGETHLSFNHFLSAAEKGHMNSAYWVGTMYLHGEGCESDKEEAKHYLTLAANDGHFFAKRDIALAQIKGTFGKRRVLSGLFRLFSAIIAGAILVLKDPNNPKIR